jgi:hypothetical protein
MVLEFDITGFSTLVRVEVSTTTFHEVSYEESAQPLAAEATKLIERETS